MGRCEGGGEEEGGGRGRGGGHGLRPLRLSTSCRRTPPNCRKTRWRISRAGFLRSESAGRTRSSVQRLIRLKVLSCLTRSPRCLCAVRGEKVGACWVSCPCDKRSIECELEPK